MTERPEAPPVAEAPPVSLALAPGKALLQLRLGHASVAVPDKVNEDFCGIVTPAEEPEAASRGIAVAISDGVSGDGGGRLASETTVKSLLRDFYGAPAKWNIAQALDTLLRSTNDWLHTYNTRHPEHEAAVCTLTMTLFKGSHYYMAHVGDTRVYRLRGEVFKQLTSDHTWRRSDMRHVLKRAVGLDSHLVVDFFDGELIPGDVFLFVSDGTWEVLGERVMRETIESGRGAQAAADELVQRSIRNQKSYMGRNDATAMVVQVEQAA
jgi:protein phosphatase